MDDDDDIPDLVVATQEEEEQHASQKVEAPPDLVTVEPEKTPRNDAADLTKSTEGSADAGEVEECPITLLTGFLGSGKTTLLDYILTEQHDRKIAVIVNEFGDTAGIDSKSLSVSDPTNEDGALYEEMLELNNGCICCTVKDNGVKAIEALMEKRRAAAAGKGKGKERAFDYILLETTGLADPGPIAQMFWQDEALASEIYLDSIICVVDALNAVDNFDNATAERHTFIQQIAHADIILLNKVDVAPQDRVKATREAIVRINAAAPIHETVRGVVDLSKLLDVNAFSASREQAPAALDVHHRDHEHTHASEIDAISTVAVPLPVLDAHQVGRLDGLLRSLLWDGILPSSPASNKADILRTKGLFRTNDGMEHVIQGVREIYEMKEVPSGRAAEAERIEGKLVFIGRNLGEGLKQGVLSYLGLDGSVRT